MLLSVIFLVVKTLPQPSFDQGSNVKEMHLETGSMLDVLLAGFCNFVALLISAEWLHAGT